MCSPNLHLGYFTTQTVNYSNKKMCQRLRWDLLSVRVCLEKGSKIKLPCFWVVMLWLWLPQYCGWRWQRSASSRHFAHAHPNKHTHSEVRGTFRLTTRTAEFHHPKINTPVEVYLVLRCNQFSLTVALRWCVPWKNTVIWVTWKSLCWKLVWTYPLTEVTWTNYGGGGSALLTPFILLQDAAPSIWFWRCYFQQKKKSDIRLL